MAIPLESLSANLGGQVGSGLGQLLENLAANKVKQMQQTQQVKQLEEIGVQPEFAKFYVSQSPEIQKALGQNIGQFMVPKEGQVTEGATPEGGKPSGFTGTQLGEAFKSPQQKAMEERNIIARQKLFQPEITKLRESAVVERRIVKYAEDALKNVDKALTGFKGKITPDYLQSDEGQKLITDLQNIVLLKAQQGKGLPTKQRLLLENAAKAQTWHRPKVIKEILHEVMNDPDTLKIIHGDEALSGIIEKYGGELPKNFPSLLEKETKKIAHSKTKEKAAKFTKESLPSASNYGENFKAKNPVTGEYQFIIRNGNWEEI